MHKKMASELKSLAHDILRLQKNEDVFALKAKASELNDKLAVLVYIEKYIATSPQATETKEELISTFEKYTNSQSEAKNFVVENLTSEVKAEEVFLERGEANDAEVVSEVEESLNDADTTLDVVETVELLDVTESNEVNETDEFSEKEESNKSNVAEFLENENSNDIDEIVVVDESLENEESKAIDEMVEVDESLENEESNAIEIVEVDELLENEESNAIEIVEVEESLENEESSYIEEIVEVNELLGNENSNDINEMVAVDESLGNEEITKLDVIESNDDDVEKLDKENPNEVFLSVTPKVSVNSIELVDEEVLSSESSLEKHKQDTIEEKNGSQEPTHYSENISKFNRSTLENDLETEVSSDENIQDQKETQYLEGRTEFKKNTLEDELQDTISVDLMTDLFTKKIEPQTSLNDRLSINQSIKIGLNDRIAFVNNLFNQNQSDFNRVLRELNVLATFEESVKYIRYNVKSIYDWSDKEGYEDRFIEIIKRRFE